MHVLVWRFRVPEETREAFERAYGPDGDWAALFRTADGFVDTTLLRDAEDPGTYLTIDRWRSRDDVERFHSRSGEAYAALDRRLEGLASEETRVGVFDTLGG
jgi:heme-degrading monooxygenase HmoA